MHMHMYHEYESVYVYGSNAFELYSPYICTRKSLTTLVRQHFFTRKRVTFVVHCPNFGRQAEDAHVIDLVDLSQGGLSVRAEGMGHLYLTGKSPETQVCSCMFFC